MSTFDELWDQLLDHPNVHRRVLRGYILTEPVDYAGHGDQARYGDLTDPSPYTSNEETHYVELPVTYSDASASDLDAANCRELVEVFGEDAFVHLYGGHGTAGLALPYRQPLPDDPDNERLELLVDMLRGLQDYPLLSDDTHSAYISKLSDEAWEQWLSRDALSDAEDLAPSEDERDRVDDMSSSDHDRFQQLYYEFEENDWIAETATSVVNHRHDDAVRYACRKMFGWTV